MWSLFLKWIRSKLDALTVALDFSRKLTKFYLIMVQNRGGSSRGGLFLEFCRVAIFFKDLVVEISLL
jgi:hypothetical protein